MISLVPSDITDTQITVKIDGLEQIPSEIYLYLNDVLKVKIDTSLSYTFTNLMPEKLYSFAGYYIENNEKIDIPIMSVKTKSTIMYQASVNKTTFSFPYSNNIISKFEEERLNNISITGEVIIK